MIADLVGFGVGVTLALGGGHVHQDRTLTAMGLLEGSHHGADVMAVDRPHVSEAQFLKHSPNLGHCQAFHALFESVQLSRHLTLHERQVTNSFLCTAGEELHGRAQPHAIEVIGEGPDRR